MKKPLKIILIAAGVILVAGGATAGILAGVRHSYYSSASSDDHLREVASKLNASSYDQFGLWFKFDREYEDVRAHMHGLDDKYGGFLYSEKDPKSEKPDRQLYQLHDDGKYHTTYGEDKAYDADEFLSFFYTGLPDAKKDGAKVLSCHQKSKTSLDRKSNHFHITLSFPDKSYALHCDALGIDLTMFNVVLDFTLQYGQSGYEYIRDAEYTGWFLMPEDGSYNKVHIYAGGCNRKDMKNIYTDNLETDYLQWLAEKFCWAYTDIN